MPDQQGAMSDTRNQLSQRDRVAAERRVHGHALGYQPFRMKPVHFATNFLLALSGQQHRLEWLNKTSVPKHRPLRDNDQYVAEVLHPILIEQGRLGKEVTLPELKALRAHLNAAFNNDGAALAARFDGYSSFGIDYSTPALSYLAGQSKNHGLSGSFVVQVLSLTEDGKSVIAGSRRILERSSTPAAELGRPLQDAETLPWEDPFPGDLAPGATEMAQRAAAVMHPQTAALRLLVTNIERLQPSHALRYLVIGACAWLILYQLRRVPGVPEPVLLMDCLQGNNPRLRDCSQASYAQALDRFARSYAVLRETGHLDACSDADWRIATDSGGAKLLRALEEHFRDFAVRCGFAQPRSSRQAHKHFELQADTLRVLAWSVLGPDELVELPTFADRLRDTWAVCVGASSADGNQIRNAGIGPLDSDDDLVPNAKAFKELLVRLNLAVEPSDGLALCALNPEDHI
ncbi:hypothetical protein [Azospirillum argentinense]